MLYEDETLVLSKTITTVQARIRGKLDLEDKHPYRTCNGIYFKRKTQLRGQKIDY